jgi:hypothetical protein
MGGVQENASSANTFSTIYFWNENKDKTDKTKTSDDTLRNIPK